MIEGTLLLEKSTEVLGPVANTIATTKVGSEGLVEETNCIRVDDLHPSSQNNVRVNCSSGERLTGCDQQPETDERRETL